MEILVSSSTMVLRCCGSASGRAGCPSAADELRLAIMVQWCCVWSYLVHELRRQRTTESTNFNRGPGVLSSILTDFVTHIQIKILIFFRVTPAFALRMDNSDTNTTYAMITPILIKGKTQKQPNECTCWRMLFFPFRILFPDIFVLRSPQSMYSTSCCETC